MTRPRIFALYSVFSNMKKLKMHSPHFAEENIAKLAALFPGCVTESTDADGNLKKAIDFDLLRQELATSIVEGPQERYHLNWPGKREALLTANYYQKPLYRRRQSRCFKTFARDLSRQGKDDLY